MTGKNRTLPRCHGISAQDRRANVRPDCSTYESGTLWAGVLMALLFGACCIFEAVLG